MPEQNNIAFVLYKHLRDETTIEEEIHIQDWIDLTADNKIFFLNIHDPDWLTSELLKFDDIDLENGWKIIKEKIAKRERP